MNSGKPVFSQLMDWIHPQEFERCVRRYGADYKVKSFSCWDQFLCMAFAQLTYRESLRDIEICLRSRQSQLYHMGFRGHISRNTLSHANEHRPWKVYEDLALRLIAKARKLYAQEDFGFELAQTAYALDASTIDLCLSLFPWARFRKTKAGIKLHTLLDLRGNIPSLIHMSQAKSHEVHWLDQLLFEPGSFYIMDRGYLDFKRLQRIHNAGAFFLIRAKNNTALQRVYSRPIDKPNGVHVDQTVRLLNFYARKDYPQHLRLVKFYHPSYEHTLLLLTNNFELPALTIAMLYKARWQIELFFKWIKQNLRIKSFYGTSDNAVRTQIWIAVCVYVLVAIIKKQLNLPQSLYQILQILSINAFEKTSLHQLLTKTDCQNPHPTSRNQLSLNI